MVDAFAEVVLPAHPIAETVAFFRKIGFRLDEIRPADAPQSAALSGFGTRLRLETQMGPAPASLLRLRVPANQLAKPATAPNGTRIEFAPLVEPALEPPAPTPTVVVHRCERPTKDGQTAWGTGRAGMHYRDLIPNRLGGAWIASHIRIPDGGPVPDDVHFHEIHSQLIYCVTGEVQLVYEDQGEPFWMRAGDCVVQPPRIRHRVLTCSDGLEVIELASPAEHPTKLDHDLQLPNGRIDRGRLFDGQRFHHFQAAAAAAGQSAPGPQNLGLHAATAGRIDGDVCSAVDLAKHDGTAFARHCEQTTFAFVLKGSCRLEIRDATENPDANRADSESATELARCDAFSVPAGTRYRLSHASDELRLLRFRLALA
ncbi:MAG: cupin domain-containing protein [Planctomycetota bacterium]